MKLYYIIILLLLCSCKVVKQTTDNSKIDKNETSVSTENIISLLKDSSNVSVNVDSVRVVVTPDSVGNPSILISAIGVKVKGGRTMEGTTMILRKDSSNIETNQVNDISITEDKTIIAEPPNVTIIIIVCVIIVILLIFFQFRKFL